MYPFAQNQHMGHVGLASSPELCDGFIVYFPLPFGCQHSLLGPSRPTGEFLSLTADLLPVSLVGQTPVGFPRSAPTRFVRGGLLLYSGVGEISELNHWIALANNIWNNTPTMLDECRDLTIPLHLERVDELVRPYLEAKEHEG